MAPVCPTGRGSLRDEMTGVADIVDRVIRRLRLSLGATCVAITMVMLAGCQPTVDRIDPGSATSQPATGSTFAPPDGAESAFITYVHDGDTLYIDRGDGDELKVRLLGIDTPEIGDRAECFGIEARDAVRDLLPEGSEVWVLADTDPLDQYGRTLLHLWTTDGIHVNRWLIDEGYAEARFYRPNWLFEDEFRDAERTADSAGVGLWGFC